MSLFGQSSDGRREPKSLVEFRAGKMKLEGKTVTADTRKGLVYLKMMEDSLLHFYWKDRQTGKVEDDFIIFPGDAEIRRISQCTTGRVLLLKFKDSGNRKFFYWLQEPKEDKDDEYVKKVNDVINNPPDAAAIAAEGLPGGLFGGPGALDQQQLLELINQGVLGQLDGGGIGRVLAEAGGRLSSGGARRRPSGPPSSTASSVASSTPTPVSVAPSRQQAPQQIQQPQQASTPSPQPTPAQSHQVQLGDLRNILSSIPLPPSGIKCFILPWKWHCLEPGVSLQEVVTPDVLRPMAHQPQVQDQLTPHLPATSQPLAAVLTSPQFQQALGIFDSALQSGELGPLLSQFGLGSTVTHAASTGDVAGFARALEEELRENAGPNASEEKKEEKKKKDDAAEEQ